MILINKVTPFANQTFQKDLLECILHNVNFSFISNIIVFHNNSNIILPKHNKIKLIVKSNYTDKDIIEYCKLISTDDIFIFSNPFIKFNNTLSNLEKPINVVNKIENDCFIFNRNEKLIQNNIESAFRQTKQNNKILIERKHIWTDEIKNFNIDKKTESISISNDEIKINAIIISVNYNDFLSITLESVCKLMDVTVVTSPDDIVCQNICKRFRVNCIVTDRMYDKGAKFNKGKAINEGLKSIKNPDWILLLDADVYLQPDFLEVLKTSKSDVNSLIICKRLIIKDYNDFIKWKNGENVGYIERAKGYGYFQLFNSNCQSNQKFFYSEDYLDASESDLEFRDRFKIKKELRTYVVHLGETNQNWTGRKSDSFVTDEYINNLFDNKINLSNQITFNGHRSGWQYAINSISSLSSESGIIFDGFIENKFSWKYDYLIKTGEIPYKKPWVGFFHNPQNMPYWFDYQHSPNEIIKRPGFIESLKNCVGLFTLSEYHAKWLRESLNVPVSVLYHPTETDVKQFNYKNFIKNKDKKIVQIGWWLRKLNSIYSLPIDSNSVYRKIRLETITSGYDLDNLYMKEIKEMNIEFEKRFYDNTYIINHLSNDEYDDLLSENIAFVNLYDSSANNAVIECIARSTPLLVNPLPAVIEYLGEDYPFYFDTLEEAAIKANDFDLIERTNIYMNNLKTKKLITSENFLESFKNSEVYKLI